MSWRKDGVPLRSSTTRPIKAEGERHTLLVRSARVADAGLYTVTATNEVGATCCSAILSVRPGECRARRMEGGREGRREARRGRQGGSEGWRRGRLAASSAAAVTGKKPASLPYKALSEPKQLTCSRQPWKDPTVGGAGSGCEHPLPPSKQPSVRPPHLPRVPLDIHQPALQPADHVDTPALSLKTMRVLPPLACEPWGYPSLIPNPALRC